MNNGHQELTASEYARLHDVVNSFVLYAYMLARCREVNNHADITLMY